jgi:membrane protein implicated in regulation of membrane protease activity
MIAGAILLGAELAFVNAQFYLVFIGAAAIVAGLVTLAAPALALWGQWAVFALLAAVSMVLFRSRVYQRLRGTMPAVRSGPAGGVLTLQVSLSPGETCQAEHGGSFWTVRNDTAAPIPSGTRVRITGVHDLTLLVKPDS